MGGDELHFRYLGAQKFLRLRQVQNTRADIETLPTPVMLPHDRLAHDHWIERHHERAHRQTVHGRRGDQAQFLDARKGHLQGARYRRGGQCQDMDVAAQLFQALLVGDAEMLFLVDHQQGQVLKGNLFAQQRMGADDDIHLAVRDALAGRRRIRRANQSR